MFFDIDNQDYDKGVILAVSNCYNKLYYFNEDFDNLPELVKNEIQAMLVLHTEEMGGILILGFNEEGEIFLESTAKDMDSFYDEIGSHLKIKQYRIDKSDLFESLQQYYNCFF